MSNTKQAAWIAVGSLASFGFALISSMILSRFLSKTDYGTYKQVMYVYDTLLIVFTLGLPRAYSFFLPRVPVSQAKSLIIKVSLLFLFLGGLMSLLLYTQAEIIASLLNNDELVVAIRLFSVVPSILLPTMGLDGILASFKRARLIAFYHVSTKILMVLFVALPVMLFDRGYKSAIIGFIVASTISLIIAECLIFIPLHHYGNDKCEIAYKQILAFSIPLLFSSFWGIILNSVDQFFISHYFGTDVFAEFANGNMELPFVGMIIGASATVLSPLFSEKSNGIQNPKESIFPTWKNAFNKSAMLIYPLALYAIFFSDVIMVFLYGQQYKVSGVYFGIKTIVSFFNVIAIGPLLINVGKVKIYSYVQLWTAVIVVLFEYLFVNITQSSISVPIIQLVCRAGATIAYLVIIADYFGTRFVNLIPFGTILSMITIGFLTLIPIRFIIYLVNWNVATSLLISFIVYGIFYFFMCKRRGINYMNLLKSIKD